MRVLTLTAHTGHSFSLQSDADEAVRHRFERTRDLADLDRTVELGEEAVKATPADGPGQVEHLQTTATGSLTLLRLGLVRRERGQPLCGSGKSVPTTRLRRSRAT
jgi:hypothetical protein